MKAKVKKIVIALSSLTLVSTTPIVLTTISCGSNSSNSNKKTYDWETLTASTPTQGEVPIIDINPEPLGTPDSYDAFLRSVIADDEFRAKITNSFIWTKKSDKITYTTTMKSDVTFSNNIFPKNFRLPTSLVNIPAGVFKDTIFSSDFFLPSALRTIEANAFENVVFLGSLTIYSITDLPANVFAGSVITGSLTLPTSLRTIEQYAFKNSAIESLAIPTSVSVINPYVFQNANIQNLTLNTNLEKIYEYAFDGATLSKTFSLIKNTSLKSMGYQAFNNASLNVNFKLPDQPLTYENSPGSLVTQSGAWFYGVTIPKRFNIPKNYTKELSVSAIVPGITIPTGYNWYDTRNMPRPDDWQSNLAGGWQLKANDSV